MYDTGGSHSVCRPASGDLDVAQRLNWLGHELNAGVQRRRLAFESDRLRALAMRRPVTTEEAYQLFGGLLGLLPPFAIFDQLFLRRSGTDELWMTAICVGMNLVCCLVGRWLAGHLGRWMGDPHARRFWDFALMLFVVTIAWAAVTGGLGGLVFFGFGAIGGVFFATPVAFAAFPLFAFLHRLLSRGGMIEERHVWPLALGIPLTLAAIIMNI